MKQAPYILLTIVSGLLVAVWSITLGLHFFAPPSTAWWGFGVILTTIYGGVVLGALAGWLIYRLSSGKTRE